MNVLIFLRFAKMSAFCFNSDSRKEKSLSFYFFDNYGSQ